MGSYKCFWFFGVVVVMVPSVVVSLSTISPLAQQCTAGVVFLRTFDNKSDNNIIPTLPSQQPNTYVLQVSYACDASPLTKIEKLRERVKDPFVSFFLKKRRGVKRIKRLAEYGSGDYDDDEDDDDEEEEEEEHEEEALKTIEPSNHVVVLLPTPTLTHEVDVGGTTALESGGPALSRYSPEVTTSFESISPTRSFYPTHSYSYRVTTEDENLVFPNLGSGDGPVVQTTPIYNPTDQSYVSSSYTPYLSSYTPTPSLTAHLLHPIPKQLIYSGVLDTFVIPPGTFQPPCFEYEFLGVAENWVSVKGNVVKFFPVTTHISDYEFKVECKDHAVVTDMIVSVRQRQKSRLHNHAFVLEFGMIRGNFSRVEVLERVVDEVSRVVGGGSGNSSDLVVLSYELDTYPFRVTYVNESIVSNVCPVEDLKRIYAALVGVNGFVKMERAKLVIPEGNNQCGGEVVFEVTGEDGGRVTYGENYPPTIKNQIDRVNGSVGEYLVYGVKEDFCYDPEDGGTRNLGVELKNSELGELGEDYWLQFDGKNQEFYGLPMGVEERGLVLVCSDKGGRSTHDVIELQIGPERTNPATYNAEFNVHFQSVPFTPKAVRKFVEKLASILSNQIQVGSYSESNNHVLFKWFNTSNPSSEHQVTEIRKVMLSDDGPVNKRFFEHFSPEFNVTVAGVVPLKGMLSENNPVDEKVEKEEERGGRYFDFDSGEGEGLGKDIGAGDKNRVEGVANVDNYSGYLTTYIIPSVLIAVMILLALIIACLLSRKNKYTQASTEDDSPNSRVYLKNAKKGVPVIFQDELDEKLFGNGGGTERGGTAQRGNIYEPPGSRSGTGTPHAQHAPPQRNDSSSTGMQSPRVISPQPNHGPRGGYPAPPDYQNSISRSMMRNRAGVGGGIGSPPPAGGIPVFPHHHLPYNQHHAHPHHAPNQIDAYAPPPGINYYGIHNSASGGSGFSGVSDRASERNYGGNQGHHHHHHGASSNKMAPPPYVPP